MAADITEKAMQVAVSFKCWPARKTDKKVAKEVAQRHNADENVVSCSKKLLPDAPKLDEIKALIREIQDYVKTVSLPWQDGESSGEADSNGAIRGTWRVLPGELYFPFQQKMREYNDRFRTLVNQFFVLYPGYTSDAKFKLGSMSVDREFPSVEELRDKFAFSHAIKGIDSGGDFRCKLLPEEIERIRAEIDQRVKGYLEAGMRDVWKRLYKVINHMAGQLGDPDAKLYKVTLANVKELVDLLPALNITSDQELAQLAEKANANLCQHTADALRNDPQLRYATAESAAQLAKEIADVLGIPAEELAEVKPPATAPDPDVATMVLPFADTPANEAEGDADAVLIGAESDRIFDHMAAYMGSVA